MEIKSTGRVNSTGIRRVGGSTSAPSSSSFSVSEAAEQPHAQTIAAPGTVASVESILTLQGMDDSTDGRSRHVQYGEHLLDMLDEVRDGLLAGGIPRGTLNRLATAVSRRHEGFADPSCRACSTRSSCAPRWNSPSSNNPTGLRAKPLQKKTFL